MLENASTMEEQMRDWLLAGLGENARQTAVCANCKFFLQHFVMGRSRIHMDFSPTMAGHCVCPRRRLKLVKAHDSCDGFQKK